VTSALNTVNGLNTSLGGWNGNSPNDRGSGQTINASSGMLDATGNEVFTVAANGFNNNSGGITISGTASQFVVVNVEHHQWELRGPISLSGGITGNQMLFNFVGTGSSVVRGGGSTTSNNDFQIVSGAHVVPAPLIGHGFPVLLGVGGLLFGAELFGRGTRRRSLGTPAAWSIYLFVSAVSARVAPT
jgi:hypothetical protein